MKRYLLDSNHIELLTRDDARVSGRVFEVRKNGSVVGTATPIAGEYLAGAKASASSARNYPKARGIMNELRLWPYDFAAAEEYARLYADLRKRGVTMQPIDLMAASIARLLSVCTVVTTDSDFSRVPGLSVENWSEPANSP